MLKETKCVVSVERGWLKEYFLSLNALSATVGWSDETLLERVAVFPVVVGHRLEFVLIGGVWSLGGCEVVLASCSEDVTSVGGSVTFFAGLDSVTRLGLEMTGFVIVVEDCGLVITILSFCSNSCVCVGIVMAWAWVGLLVLRNLRTRLGLKSQALKEYQENKLSWKNE